jgi:hypothetical protein
MRKIALQLESIRVDSFATTPRPGGDGTVAGFESDPPFPDVKPSEGVTCGGTCIGRTCQDSCDCASNQATCDTCQGPNCNEGVA